MRSLVLVILLAFGFLPVDLPRSAPDEGARNPYCLSRSYSPHRSCPFWSAPMKGQNFSLVAGTVNMSSS